MSAVRSDLKNSLFIKIFGAPEHKPYLLSLFNALNNTNYAEGTEVELNTIENVIYMGIKNDVSCIIDNKMNLYEHQSTINPNMPLRGFMYFGRLYEKFVKKNKLNIYGQGLIKLPTPSYFVLYNGTDYLPDSSELKLSSSFIHEGASQKFEWTATVLNINIGRNERLLESCEALKEYSIFFEEIRSNIAAGMEKEQAIDKAINDCIVRDFILSDYLLQHKAEVVGVLLSEYNEQETMAMFKRDYEAELAKERQKAAIEVAEAKAEAQAKAAEAIAEATNAKAELSKVNAQMEELMAKMAEMQKQLDAATKNNK